MILIVSGDKDFSHVLAEHVKKELMLDCIVADKAEGHAPALVVTTEPGEYSCPAIAIKNPPVRLRDLLADIENTLQKQSEAAIGLGRGYVLQLRQKQLSYGGRLAGLTDKEAQLLQSLAAAGSQGASREQLLKDVWGFEESLNTHTLETHIYRLRGKLRELGGEEMIEAMEGGYKLL